MKTFKYSEDVFNRFNPYKILLFSQNEFFLDDRRIIYKKFKEDEIEKRKRAEKVIDKYELLNKKYIVNAENKYIKDDIMIAYGSKFIESDTLYELIRKKGILNMMKNILEVSKNLEDLHNSGENALVGDLHFSNVLIDENNNSVFIDHDSFGIGEINPETIPSSLYLYLENKSKDFNGKINFSKSLDKLSLMVSLFNITFGRDLSTYNYFSYNDYICTYPFLKELGEIYVDMYLKKYKDIDVPYLHKVLKNYDNS